ncbi:hypothetical protein COCON_G00087770 [Conger conger]|uniref:Uncharacterized protein n=1 Tax=Conger conger TaxID=82655 RepID=A0A9Q1DKD2_CONCO|nr:hypothetical protein COCON_G00087770 [Conger conger]
MYPHLPSSRGPAVQSSSQPKPRPAPTEGPDPAEAAALPRLLPDRHPLKEEEEVALNECGLVPSALLSLCWDAAVQAAEASAGGPSAPLLRAEVLENIQTISAPFTAPPILTHRGTDRAAWGIFFSDWTVTCEAKSTCQPGVGSERDRGKKVPVSQEVSQPVECEVGGPGSLGNWGRAAHWMGLALPHRSEREKRGGARSLIFGGSDIEWTVLVPL